MSGTPNRINDNHGMSYDNRMHMEPSHPPDVALPGYPSQDSANQPSAAETTAPSPQSSDFTKKIFVVAAIVGILLGFVIGLSSGYGAWGVNCKDDDNSTSSPNQEKYEDCAAVCADLEVKILNKPIGFATQGTPATIYPDFEPRGLSVYCDCTDGQDKVWTVFQRRFDGSLNFYRGWEKYITGFGDPEGEFWLGLDHIYRFTQDGECELHVDLRTHGGVERYAEYGAFTISEATDRYRLSVSGYVGDAGDSLSALNNVQFCTERLSSGSTCTCARDYDGAWWFSSRCQLSHLNGPYRGSTELDLHGIVWSTVTTQSLQASEMKFRC